MRLPTPGRLARIYQRHFHDSRRERLFLSSVSFFCTFATVRGITHSIRAGRGPFHNVGHGSIHVHHLVWGILGVQLVAYLWLIQIGTGVGDASRRASALSALLFGAGSALTLDEFALWLNLEDVYWSGQGRESIDAVILFGALLSAGFWGRPFLHALGHELQRVVNSRHSE